MSENANIEWTDHTFNPWWGCQKVGPGCDHCYAETLDKRTGGEHWGPGAQRRLTGKKNWNDPVRWNAKADSFFAEHGRRQRVFCASMADVFDNAVPENWRIDLFSLIEATTNLDWLLLTKRIGNVASMLPWSSCTQPWSHVWIGATVVNQEEADRDVPKLLAVPAAKRFLSMEPLLGAVNLTHLNDGKEVNEVNSLKPDTWGDEIAQWRGTEDGWEESFEEHYGIAPTEGLCGPMHNRIDWVIVGGESGHGARPMHPAWVRSLRDQCNESGVPFLFKQWGQWREPVAGETFDTSMGRSAKPPAFILSEAGSVHCFENEGIVNGKVVINLGKKASGRLVDGLTWDEVPQ